MIAGALFYYQFCSQKNRLLTQMRRLRRPRYLAGAMVGALYFYAYIFRGFSQGRRGTGAAMAAWQSHGLAESMAALVLLILMLMAWVLPHSRAALAFSEAEVAFLFPAPIGRRTLINFKLLKSQVAILFSSLLMALIGRGWGAGNFSIRGLGWWVLLSAFNLHLLASSFALTLWMGRGLSNWMRRAIFLGAAGTAAAGILLWARAALPPIVVPPDAKDLAWLAQYAGQVLQSGPLPWLLLPFRWLVAPYFAATFAQFFIALGPALLFIGLLYWWVIRSDVAFEEASVELSQKLAQRLATASAGDPYGMRKPAKAARPPFTLRPLGNPEMAVFWKNLISAGSFVTGRMWLMLLWIIIIVGGVLQSQVSRGGALGPALLYLAVMLVAMSLFSGPQLLRNDLRQDLPVTDVLKMYPMRGWQIVLGEVLAPAAVLAGAQWLLLVMAAIFFPTHLGPHAVSLFLRLSCALAAAVVLPFIDLIAILIPNAAVLFFPAWFQLGKQGPRGFETTGQQLILMFGQLLTLALSLLPPAAVFTVVFFCASRLLGASAGVASAGIAAALLLAVEAGLAIKLLGGVFERFDSSGEVLSS